MQGNKEMWLPTLSGNNNFAVGIVAQDCLDENEWLEVNGRSFWILLYSVLFLLSSEVAWSYLVCCFRSFQSEEKVLSRSQNSSGFIVKFQTSFVFACDEIFRGATTKVLCSVLEQQSISTR